MVWDYDKLNWLIGLYWDKTLIFEEIAKETGIEWWTIKKLLKSTTN
jgi:hypothetical protein